MGKCQSINGTEVSVLVVLIEMFLYIVKNGSKNRSIFYEKCTRKTDQNLLAVTSLLNGIADLTESRVIFRLEVVFPQKG